MLQDIRDNSRGWITWVIVGLIAATFIFVGTGSFMAASHSEVLAKVNGIEVTQRQVNQFYDRFISSQDPEQIASIDSGQVRRYGLDALVSQAALTAATQSNGFRIAEEQVMRQIQLDPNFQENNRFSPALYQRLLMQNYYTPEDFQQMLVSRNLIQQLQQGLVSTNFTTGKDVDQFFKFLNQTRSFQYLIVAKEGFLEQVEVTDEDIRIHYDVHSDDFMTQEKVKLEFVELNPEHFIQTMDADSQALKGHYEQTIDLYSDPNKVKVAHILVSFDETKEGELDKAIEKVKGIEKELSEGASFADLAKAHSDDPSTKNKGGELFWVSEGNSGLVPEFEKAAFELKTIGDVSEPVQTAFGLHLIKLMDKKQASVSSFDEVKEKVERHYKLTKAQEKVRTIADDLVSIAYENTSSLSAAEEKLGLKVETTDWVSELDLAARFENPGVSRMAFSAEIVQDGLNSDLIELGPDHYMVLRVSEHKESQLKSLDEVKPLITLTLRDEKASKLAKEKAESIQAKISSDNDLVSIKESDSGWVQVNAVSRTDASVPTGIIRHAFEIARVDEAQEVKTDLAKVNLGDWAVIAVTEVKDGNLSEVEANEVDYMKQSLAINYGTQDMTLFTQYARSKVKYVED